MGILRSMMMMTTPTIQSGDKVKMVEVKNQKVPQTPTHLQKVAKIKAKMLHKAKAKKLHKARARHMRDKALPR